MILKPKNKPSATAVLTSCILLAFLGFNFGCGTQERWTSYKDDGFKPSVLRKEPFAMGGVVLHSSISLDKFAGVDFAPEELTPMIQANLWTPLFAQVFHDKFDRFPDVDWFHFTSKVPYETQEELLAIQASYSLVTPEILDVCHRSLPGIRYLLMGRIDGVELDARSHFGSGLFSSGRLVIMTLDIYDLDLGRSLYTHSVEYYDSGPKRASYDDIDRAVRVQLPDSSGNNIDVAGHVLNAPLLYPVLKKTMYSLLRCFYSPEDYKFE